MRRTCWYAAVTRDKGNAADDVLMVDQGFASCLPLSKESAMGSDIVKVHRFRVQPSRLGTKTGFSIEEVLP